ncbi:MAG TPA: DUF2085 domain-containing protein [Bacteroidota bacterium]|nr:DUF2085 domain-containing protein [Bacteroidota bacterium]
MRYARITYTIVALGAGLWCALILAAPLSAASRSLAPISDIIYAFFRPLCHQLASRSFFVSRHPLAVCARCSSVYFGFFLGTLAYPLLRNLRPLRAGGLILLGCACAPMAFDIALSSAGLFETTNFTRAVTGAWFGLIMPFVFIPGAVEGIHQLFLIRQHHSIQ